MATFSYERERVRRALEACKSITARQKHLICRGIPAIVASVNERFLPQTADVVAPKLGKEQLPAELGGGEVDVWVHAARTSDRSLGKFRTLLRELDELSRAITDEQSRALIAAGSESLRQAYTRLSLRLVTGAGELPPAVALKNKPKGGNRVDQYDRALLIELAKLFLRQKVKPVSGRQSAYEWAASALLNKISINHTRIMDAISEAKKHDALLKRAKEIIARTR